MSGIKSYTPDYDHRKSYPVPDLAVMRSRLAEIGEALHGLPDGQIIPANDETVAALLRVQKLLDTISSATPRVGPLWVCGYGSSFRDSEVFWEWSGHLQKADAELFLPMWKGAYPRDTWEIRTGTCDIGEYMPHGTDPAKIRKALHR